MFISLLTFPREDKVGNSMCIERDMQQEQYECYLLWFLVFAIVVSSQIPAEGHLQTRFRVANPISSHPKHLQRRQLRLHIQIRIDVSHQQIQMSQYLLAPNWVRLIIQRQTLDSFDSFFNPCQSSKMEETQRNPNSRPSTTRKKHSKRVPPPGAPHAWNPESLQYITTQISTLVHPRLARSVRFEPTRNKKLDAWIHDLTSAQIQSCKKSTSKLCVSYVCHCILYDANEMVFLFKCSRFACEFPWHLETVWGEKSMSRPERSNCTWVSSRTMHHAYFRLCRLYSHVLIEFKEQHHRNLSIIYDAAL